MKAAIYARVSTDKQGRDQTIDSQLGPLRRWAAAHGHELKGEHVYIDEGYSGVRLDRPALDRLRDAAREGEFDVVGVFSPDRLARRYAYQVLLLEELRKAACAVEFIERPISDDPHDQLLLQIQGAIAEYERAVLAERFRRGKLQKARAGQWVGGRAPYGYRYVPKRDGVPGHLVVDEAEAEVVRMLYRWLIEERTTVRQILKRLADGPWRPRNGKRLWSNSVVHRVLSDAVYTGTAHTNRNVLVPPRKPRSTGPRAGLPSCRKPRPREEWIPVPVPAIIDEATHQHAIDQLARNSALSFRNNTRNDYLLRCLLTCRTCGLAMFGVTTSGTGGRRVHRYYMCHGKDTLARDRACRCPQARTKVEELDAAVWGHITGLLDDPATLAAQFEERARQADAVDSDAHAAGQKCEAQLRRLDREEQRLLDAYQAEAIDLNELKQRREQIRVRRHVLATQHEQEQRLRSERQTAKEVWADLAAFCQRVRSRLDEATLAERQRILQLLIDRVIVGPDSLEIRHVIPLGGLRAESASPSPADPEGSGGGEGSEPEGGTVDPGARLRSDGVRQALLLLRADDRVVGRPEVGHQHPGELLLEELLQGRGASAAVDHVVGQIGRRKAPQPMGLAVDPPAGLVGVQHRAAQGLGLDLQVPDQEDLAEPPPHLHQAPGGELEVQVEIEDVEDLGQRHAQQVVEPGREHHDPQADGRAGQGIGHDRLDGVAALRAPVPRDDVLGDHRGDVGGDVLDDPRPRRAAGPHRPVALGARRERMLLAAIDSWRRGPTMPGMSRLGALGLGPPFGGRLDVRGCLPRGR
jgi:site-specific DNA recombinase